MNLIKKPILQARNPFTGRIHQVRVLSWDKARKVAAIVDEGGHKRTIPFSYFRWIVCGDRWAA